MRVFSTVSVVVILLSLVVGTARAGVQYNVTDLGTLGGSGGYAYAINASGQVAGWAYTTRGYERAFLYSNGAMTGLGTLPGGSYSEALSINDSGQVAGDADAASGDDHAFLYSNGAMTDLNKLLSGGWNQGQAYGINASGQVVGVAYYSDVEERAFLYNNGAMRLLGVAGGIANQSPSR